MAKKATKRTPQLRSRQTRSSKGRRLLSNPEESTQALNQQLAALGLYAVQTLGDGNCLFRSLSDQYYGSDSRHAQVRQDICDWIATHQSRYAPFVDDDRGIDDHLRCMRENGTYGGHMELSAFAHLTRRNIKVIQPGLVYVIEWNAGGDPGAFLEDSDDSPSEARERRRQRRERIKEKKQVQENDNVEEDSSDYRTMYVAYHDWEHFSSIRNLKGPHGGLPIVQETSAPTPAEVPPPPSSKHAQKSLNVKRVKLKLRPPSPAPSPPKVHASPTRTLDPLAVPLPSSRSPSPSLPLSSLSSLSPSPAPYPPSYAQLDVDTVPRTTRSPKRNFDESSSCPAGEDGDEYGSEGGAKRARMGSVDGATAAEHHVLLPNGGMNVDDVGDDDASEEDDEHASQAPNSSASVSSQASSAPSSSSSSPSPPPPSYTKPSRTSDRVKQMQRKLEKEPERPLTRRQRKKLGLPADKNGRTGAGVIIIPPGKRRQAASATSVNGAIDKGEWLKNGNGRVDVRGFRELRI